MKTKEFNGEVYDFHGKTVAELDAAIDRLSMSNKVVKIITGNGRGILKERIWELQKEYGFKVLFVASNDAAFIVDFTWE